MTGERRVQQVTLSTLWAAWADALGFISELTDAAGLRRRLEGDGELKEPVAWKRRVGGKFGVTMPLPAGCYSDDTQLRLATARAISKRGFDIEAFAAVELTLWPAYALGGGRASKAAAAGFTKPNTPWFANFFDGWVNAGGNGAAMRMQPHVWAASRPGEPDYLQDVVLNAITTHGHPRALVGAVLHAFALGQTMSGGEVVPPRYWSDLLEGTGPALSMLEGHDMASSVWIPAWEKTTGSSFNTAWAETIEETRVLLDAASSHVEALADDQTPHGEAYAAMCKQLGLFDDATRGSGTATVVAALALAAAHPRDPQQCALVACRAVGTDTDTIATMAAAIAGAAASEAPPTPVQDHDYLCAQAARLVALSGEGEVAPTRYPDLLTWQPPRSQLDAVGLVDGQPALGGLTLLSPMTDEETAFNRDAHWSWFSSELGPTFLLKHRHPSQLKELPKGNRPLREATAVVSRRDEPSDVPNEQIPLINPEPRRIVSSTRDKLAAELKKQYEKGASIKTMAESTGRSYGFVHRVLSEAGVTLRGPGNAVRDRTSSESHPTLVEREGGTRVDVDQMLEWLARQDYSDHSIGYAVKRMSRLGTVEQLIALITALRGELGSSRSPVDSGRP